MAALIAMTAAIAPASNNSPKAKETTVAAARRITMMLRNCDTRISHAPLLFISRNRFGPRRRKRSPASSAESPVRRSVESDIVSSLTALVQHIDVSRRQIRLFEEVLLVQAEQSLRSAESAYAAGTVNALDLLDAERLLLEVRTSAARARADHAIAVARLEGAIAAPLATLSELAEVNHD